MHHRLRVRPSVHVFVVSLQALQSRYVGMAAKLVEQYGPDVAEAALKTVSECGPVHASFCV